MSNAVNYDEFVKVEDGDFAKTIKWDENDANGGQSVFIGTYRGAESRNVKGESRTFQTFTAEDGEPIEAWGTAILDSRLKSVPVGARVKVVYLGKNAKTKRGNLAHNFEVYVAAGSIPAGA